MISDEMRELLSAYVDGELRDADAARVEDASKRDPELRREIEAYRTLRKKLKEWDAADHAAAPGPALATRTLARARAMDAALAAPARFALFGPLAMAASVLVAVGLGYGIARSTAPEAPPEAVPATSVAVTPLAPAPDLALKGSALVSPPEPGPALVRGRIDDHIPSRRAIELEEAMRPERLVRAIPPVVVQESRTSPAKSAEISAMVAGSMAASMDSLVVLARPGTLSGLPPIDPAPIGQRLAQDGNTSEGRIRYAAGAGHMVAPLGEVWTAAKDGRTRLVAASDWIAPKEIMLVRVTWGDGTLVPRSADLLEAQETVLGPKARRRLLSAKTGPDADFLDWLKGAYGAGPLPALLAAGAKDREREVNKFLDALRADATSTGFAVLGAKGSLLGVEMFSDHAAMLAFAPRLLRGYLLEAGEDGIRVTPPTGALGLEKVQGFLEALPARGVRVEREKLEDVARGYARAPKGLCRANLVGVAGEILGHGLLVDDTPIHLTLFGE